jgi:hypothetical protein
MRTWCALIFAIAFSEAAYAGCPMRQAVYGLSEGEIPYSLTIRPTAQNAVTEFDVRLASEVLPGDWIGKIVWTNGFTRPHIHIGPRSEKDPVYSSEIFALTLDRKGRIQMIELPQPTKAAPPALLLPELCAVMYYWSRNTLGETVSPATDLFWVSKCEKSTPASN